MERRKICAAALALALATFVFGMSKIPTASAVSPVVEMYNKKIIESESKTIEIGPETTPPAIVVEKESLAEALLRGIPQDVAGKTYRGNLEACIDPKYIEAVDHAHNEAATHEEGKRKGATLYRFFMSMGKCVNPSDKAYEYTVLETYDNIMKIHPRHAKRYDLETLGMVKIQVHTDDEAFPKILFMTIVFPGVNT